MLCFSRLQLFIHSLGETFKRQLTRRRPHETQQVSDNSNDLVEEESDEEIISEIMDIFQAIENHNMKRIEEILTSDPTKVNVGMSTRSIFRRSERSDKPIHLATCKGFSKIVEMLISYGAEVNASNQEGKTALHIATDNYFVDMVNLFLEKDANVNAVDARGSTALHLAANRGYLEILTALLEHEANPNIADSNAKTPIWYAAKKGSLACVKALLDRGADASDSTPTMIKLLNNVTVQGNTYILSMLLMNNASVNAQDENGKTALHHAMIAKRLMCVKMLLEKGAQLKIKDKNGDSSLLLAVRSGSRDIIKHIANNYTGNAEDTQEYKLEILGIITKKQTELASMWEISMNNEDQLQNLQKELDDINEMKSVVQQEIDQSKEIISREEERMAIHRGLLESLETDERNVTAKMTKEKSSTEKQCLQRQNIQDEIDELLNLTSKLSSNVAGNVGDAMASNSEVNSIPEECLECPICCVIPQPPVHVYQCREGHIYCGECKNKPNMDRCPVCKTDIKYSAIRNRYMENRIAELIPVPENR